MEQKTIRLLNANEIECRVGTISEKGLSLLLYKDARADMRLLDEVYGPSNWQRTHEMIGGNLFCRVSIWDEEKKTWVSKMDVGTESYTEKEKGQASDSFKRACVSVGIGRELYTAPFIWIGASKVNIKKKDKEDRFITYDKFRVNSISYNDNQDGRIVYSLIDRASNQPEIPTENNTEPMDERLLAINKELKRTGVPIDTVLQRYGVQSITQMDEGTFKKAMNSLKRTKTKAA
jgi:hypothetical protein